MSGPATLLKFGVADLPVDPILSPLVARYYDSLGFGSNSAGPRTAAVVTNAGDWLVVIALAEDTLTVWGTPSGNSLTYSLKATATGANRGRVQIWTAQDNTGGSYNVSLTATTSPDTWGLVVLRFDGSLISGVGPNVGSANNTTAQMNAAITTTAANSTVVAAAADWQALSLEGRVWANINNFLPTHANQGEQVYSLQQGNFTAYVGFWPDVGDAGSVTPSATRNTTGGWSMASIELLKATAPLTSEFEGWGVPI